MDDDKTSVAPPHADENAGAGSSEADFGRPQGDRASRPVVYSDDVQPSEVAYEVVEHDGGWAYRVGTTFSETFPTRGDAVDAAARASFEHLQPGDDELIEYQDEDGSWHSELAPGGDRPRAHIEDTNPLPSRWSPETVSTESERAREVIRGRPLLAIAVAMALGFILGSR